MSKMSSGVCFACEGGPFRNVTDHVKGIAPRGVKPCAAYKSLYGDEGTTQEWSILKDKDTKGASVKEWSKIYGKGASSTYIRVKMHKKKLIVKYVGKAADVRRRINSYSASHDQAVFVLASEQSPDGAHNLEACLLQCHLPSHPKCQLENRQIGHVTDYKGYKPVELRKLAVRILKKCLSKIQAGEVDPVRAGRDWKKEIEFDATTLEDVTLQGMITGTRQNMGRLRREEIQLPDENPCPEFATRASWVSDDNMQLAAQVSEFIWHIVEERSLKESPGSIKVAKLFKKVNNLYKQNGMQGFLEQTEFNSCLEQCIMESGGKMGRLYDVVWYRA